jgi:hypothetical protein
MLMPRTTVVKIGKRLAYDLLAYISANIDCNARNDLDRIKNHILDIVDKWCLNSVPVHRDPYDIFKLLKIERINKHVSISIREEAVADDTRLEVLGFAEPVPLQAHPSDEIIILKDIEEEIQKRKDRFDDLIIGEDYDS